MSLKNKKVKDYLNIKNIKLNDCLEIFKHDYLKYKKINHEIHISNTSKFKFQTFKKKNY